MQDAKQIESLSLDHGEPILSNWMDLEAISETENLVIHPRRVRVAIATRSQPHSQNRKLAPSTFDLGFKLGGSAVDYLRSKFSNGKARVIRFVEVVTQSEE